MRISFTILLLIGALSSLSSQECEIPNSSFENWEDLTIQFDTTGTIQSETILLPEGYISFIRLFFLSFENIFGQPLDQLTADALLGVSRSENASEGDFALQLGGNSILPLADVFGLFDCGQLPDRLLFDLAHLGDRPDTLTVNIFFNDSSAIPQTQADINNISGFGGAQLIADAEIGYTEFSLDIEDNMNNVPADTMFLLLLVDSDTMTVDNPNDYGFLVDNLRFEFDQPSNNHTPELAAPVKVYPMPFDESFSIDNENGELDAQIYDINGRLVTTFSVSPGTNTYDMAPLQGSGNYIMELRAEGIRERSTYNIIKK